MDKNLNRLIDLSNSAKKIYDKLYEMEIMGIKDKYDDMINNLELIRFQENRIHNMLSVEEIVSYVKSIIKYSYKEMGDIDFCLYLYNSDKGIRRVYVKLVNLYISKCKDISKNYEFNDLIDFMVETDKINIGTKDIYFFDRYDRLNNILKLSESFIMINFLTKLDKLSMIDQKYKLSYINPVLESIFINQKFDISILNYKEIYNLYPQELELLNYNLSNISVEYLYGIISSLLSNEDLDEEDIYYDKCYIEANLDFIGIEDMEAIYNMLVRFNEINNDKVSETLINTLVNYTNIKFEKKKSKV